MKTISMIQNTDDWYKMRNNYLGASEANIIMGKSKFMTALELFNQKIGEPKKDKKENNFIQAKGHRMEEKMRNVMDMIYDTEFKPLVVLSDEYPFLMASLDGYSENIGCVWENKYVGQEDFAKVANRQMLEQYKPQVQQQLLLTGAPFCVFSVVTDLKDAPNPDFPFQYTYMEVTPDYEYIKNELLPELVKFWDKVQGKEAPEMGDKDVLDLDKDNELVELLGKYKELKAMEEDISASLSDIQDNIFKKLGKAKKASCNGVKITISKSEDKEVPDYEKACSELNIDVSKFMKVQKGRTTKRITFPK